MNRQGYYGKRLGCGACRWLPHNCGRMQVNQGDLIEKARSQPNGAEFHRCALQVNSCHYAGDFQGQPLAVSNAAYAQALIDNAEALGISVLAVTDHNHVGQVDAIRDVANRRAIHVFPGFELVSSEGVHVLCLYPPNSSVNQLERYLGEFGVRSTTPSSDLCKKSFADLLAKVYDQGGISVAAHVSNDGGLFKVLQGQTRIRAWMDDHLYAIQIPGPVQNLPQDIRRIVENKNADYRRHLAPESDLAIAVVNACDVKSPNDLKCPAATCWVKMSEVGIEGLRQAFLDPGSRIRLHSDPPPVEHAELVAVAWEGGFLDNSVIRFNANLNVLLGGRGAGKSTVIESLRHVLGLEPLGESAQAMHDGIVTNVLRSGTKVSLLVRSHHPSPREYRIERTVPNPPVVRDEQTRELLNVTAADVFPGVEVYGQHEISELSGSPEKLTRLLKRFSRRDDSASARKDELRQELERSRHRIVATYRENARIDEQLAALPGLEETLKQYEEVGLEADLKEQSLLVREEGVIATAQERLQPFRSCREELRQELPIDRAFLSPGALDDLPGKEILADADRVLAQLSSDLGAVEGALSAALERADQGQRGILERFEARKAATQAAYEKKLRDLQRAKIDGAEFIRIRRQIEDLRPLREKQLTLAEKVEDEEKWHRSLLAEWEDLKASEFRELECAAKRVNRKLKDRVRVRVEFAGNRESFFQLLRERVGGRLIETINTLRQPDSLSLTAFVQACRQGAGALAEEFGVGGSQAERLAQAPSSVLMEIEELDLPSTTRIELNTAAPGSTANWKALDQLSTGQKATAVLLLLLLESTAPLIVDQPEDDLDNRFITEGVVPRMRQEKLRRQFLFATHNANIPVLGDAELIFGLSASGEADSETAGAVTERIGSIDAQPVRELIQELLEGGEDAFKRRRRKYGF